MNTKRHKRRLNCSVTWSVKDKQLIDIDFKKNCAQLIKTTTTKKKKIKNKGEKIKKIVKKSVKTSNKTSTN